MYSCSCVDPGKQRGLPQQLPRHRLLSIQRIPSMLERGSLPKKSVLTQIGGFKFWKFLSRCTLYYSNLFFVFCFLRFAPVCPLCGPGLGASCSIFGNHTCCDEECLGGCWGPGPDSCMACRHVFHGGICRKDCPPGHLKVHFPKTLLFLVITLEHSWYHWCIYLWNEKPVSWLLRGLARKKVSSDFLFIWSPLNRLKEFS